MPVTYRDFHGQFTDNDALAHNDFENEGFFNEACQFNLLSQSCPGLQNPTTGIVATALGADNTPDLENGKMVTSAATFYEWFHDTTPDGQGANPRMRKIEAGLLLTDQQDGSFLFDSNESDGFFPIDGQGFGNTPRGPESMTPPRVFLFGRVGPPIETGHNYHFTTHVSVPFLFDPGAGHIFEFIGDDDFWLYIDDQLVVDIGGIHQQVTRSITIDNGLADVAGAALDLVDGQTYRLDAFHAERHRNDSNFRIETTLPLGWIPVDGDLNINRVVDTFDLAIVLNQWARTNLSDPRADVTGDGQVNTFDLAVVLNNWGARAQSVTATPEPTSSLIIVAAMGILSGRRRRPQAH